METSSFYRYGPKPKPPLKITLGVHVFIVLLVLIHSLFLSRNGFQDLSWKSVHVYHGT